jgi:hypothetical protein
MKFRPTTTATVVADLQAFAEYLNTGALADPDGNLLRQEIAAWLNKKLDQLLASDAFGTSGQCDPRGDHRE